MIVSGIFVGGRHTRRSARTIATIPATCTVVIVDIAHWVASAARRARVIVWNNGLWHLRGRGTCKRR